MSELEFAAQLAEDLSVADLRLVLSVFCNDVRRLTAALGVAAAHGDAGEFRRVAHALAGAAGAVGAAGLELACRQAMGEGVAPSVVLAEIGMMAESALGDATRILSQPESRT